MRECSSTTMASKYGGNNEMKIDKKIFRKICNVAWNIIVTLSVISLAWYFMSLFMFASFKVPTPSMVPTLLPGDYIVVNKMAYGARLFDFRKTIRHGDISRVWGFSEPKRNDVMVFNYPYTQSWDSVSFDVLRYFVKRCVALPGDTLEIVDGYYHVRGVNEELGNVEAQNRIERVTRDTTCVSRPDIAYWAAPFWHPLYHWNIRSYGPLYIPKRGDIIKLDTINAPIYKKLIEWEINSSINNEGNDFFAGGEPLGQYQWEQDYYFMAGDNALDSQDSRYWGLVPEEFIVGRTMMIWKSKDIYNGDMRWERVLSFVK